jgi:hypothetical protein
MKTTEEYLRENSISDANRVDGTWVPIGAAMTAIDRAIKGELIHNQKTWVISSPKDELNKLVREYSLKYPYGEFSFLPMYSYNGTSVSGVLCFDYKNEIYHIEFEPIDDVIKLIKGLDSKR